MKEFRLLNFFDKLEDRVRGTLSRHPVPYSIIGGVGVVLFWDGVERTVALFPFLNGPVLLLVSLVILLSTGLFVSFFIGDQIIISGLRHEKKVTEKTKEELEEEEWKIAHIEKRLAAIEEKLDRVLGEKH